MADIDSVALARLVGEDLGSASPDLLRQMMTAFANALMSAEADAACGAPYGVASPERVNRRNGYRAREWDTRAGTVELAVPKLREGSYYPEWLLTRRRRAGQALVSVVATSYLLGVSTRRVEKLVEQLGVKGLSKSQVSQLARHLDAQVEAFRTRPLDAGPYTFCWADALTVKVREVGRTVNVHALIAVGDNADGRREILGLDLASSEDGAGWLAFFRGLVARGLSGVLLVTSDAHIGLVEAIGSALPGAAWQRCRTHYARNLLTTVPKSAQPWVATLLRTIFDQPDAEQVHAQYDRLVEALAAKSPTAADHLDEARADLLAFTAFPREVWRQTWSNNPQERLNKEIRRRTDVVGIFPDRAAVIRLIGAVLAEQNDERTEQHRYMGLELLAKSRTVHTRHDTTDEETDLAAVTAQNHTGSPVVVSYTTPPDATRGQEKLSKKTRHKLLCALADLGDAGRQIGAAWRAKELLRDLAKHSPNRTGLAATRDKVNQALETFFTFAATTGATVPEIQTLAETVSTWRTEIARAALTGHSNAAAEGVNRLVKLLYRSAFGLTNVSNQQRRSRYAASRSTRPEWLHTATRATSQPVAA